MATSRKARLSTAILTTAVLMTGALATPLLAAAKNAKIVFNLETATTCMNGTAPKDASLHLVWRAAGGALKADTHVVTSPATGYWSYCSTDGAKIAIGDRFKATVGSYTRKFAIPTMTVVVDRVHDTYHGLAPAGAAITVWYIYNRCCADYEQHQDLIADSDGKWSFTESTTDNTYAHLDWLSAKGDSVVVSDVAPSVSIAIGRSVVVGSNHISSTSARVVLRDGTTGAKLAVAVGSVDEYGSFSAEFRDRQGHPVAVSVGDKIDGTALASDMKFKVQDIEASADVGTDTVTGRCLNNAFGAEVEILRRGHRIGWTIVDLDDEGNFSVWFGDSEGFGYDPANIKHGDRVRVMCFMPKGDFVLKTIAIP